MPSSSATQTKAQIISGGLRLVGNRRPSATERSEAGVVLSSLLKRWDTDGNWVWAVSAEPTILNLQAGLETYSPGDSGPPTQLASDVLELQRAEIWKGGKPDSQLFIRSKSDWMSSALRRDSGEPIECYLQVAPALSENSLFFAPVPSAVVQVRYYFKRRIYDFESESSHPDLPQQWLRVLEFGLAAELGPEYGLALDRQAYLDNKTEFLLRKMSAANEQPADPVPQKSKYF